MSAVRVEEPQLYQGYQDTRVHRFEQNIPIQVNLQSLNCLFSMLYLLNPYNFTVLFDCICCWKIGI